MARRTWRRLLGIYLRGAAMGVAEIIPGVSGGTIAFITGIYRELLDTIAGFSLRSLGRARHGLDAFWRSHNMGFLAALVLGMLTSILVFAQLVRGLLNTVPLLVWAFFFGLILGSCIDLGRQNQRRWLVTVGPLGIALGLLLSLSAGAVVETTLTWVFVGGMLAVSAWLLPGISGGFVLLLMGLYEMVIAAVADLNVPVVLTLGAGCAIGLGLFARALRYLMRRHFHPLMALLTGFMAGSMVRLWPWQLEGPNGVEIPVSPARYQLATDHDPMLLGTAAALCCGLLVVVLLVRWRAATLTEHERFD